jgi:anti-anti-sigma regulatory factor
MTEACTLPAELTIYTVGECMPFCLAWLRTDAHTALVLDVDASHVAEVDAAGIQLLISLANGLARRDSQLRLMAPSQALQNACAQLGAGFLLNDTPQLETAS